MAYTTIDDPSAFFTTTLYTATGNAISVTNNANAGDFQPDWIWLKSRNNATNHNMFDSNRGETKRLYPNTNDAEDTVGTFALDSNGFSIGGSGSSGIGDINIANKTMVAWQWKCNGGTATATISESGSNPAASVQANTTAGFSIITYTGTGSQGTIAHGLGATPSMLWIKNRDASEGWIIDAQILTNNSNGTLHFNTDAEYTSGTNQYGSHDSTNITIKTSGNINTDGQKYVAYVFTPIKGYSKFGIFHSDNNADGTFVYLGFKPKWLIAKNITQTHDNHDWIIFDSEREGSNVIDTFLRANETTTEVTSGRNEVDFLSTGFKARASYGDFNGGSNHEFIYYAFAEHPFVSSTGTPVTAR